MIYAIKKQKDIEGLKMIIEDFEMWSRVKLALSYKNLKNFR